MFLIKILLEMMKYLLTVDIVDLKVKDLSCTISENSCNEIGEDILGCLIIYANDMTFSTSFIQDNIFYFRLYLTSF